MHTFIELTKAEYIDGYRLRLYFNTGEVRIADLEFEYLYEISQAA